MATFAEKILAAREQRQKLSPNSGDEPAPVDQPAAIEATPVVATSTTAPKRIKRRRVRDILLIHLRMAAVVVISVGLVGGGVILGTIRSDLPERAYIAGVKDLPDILLSKPCNFDRENGKGCKES